MLFPATVSVQSSSVRAAYSTTAMSHRNAYDSRFACIVQQKFPQHTHKIYTKDKYMKAKTFFFFKKYVFFLSHQGQILYQRFFSFIFTNLPICEVTLCYVTSLYSVSSARMLNCRVKTFSIVHIPVVFYLSS